ncbi:sulfite exporter TauE/SafE family protein [Caldicellulosiruptor naganoensis]|uniref:Probable membrane transporter protein n=1 Tax=Caldicellulosiruptor naganoensis TaxID=29324 RepID=A0ABY7BHC6_9FIRM|nr:sulfite exporter TauE/SafE family protein [Caldicellulosiruptor naganoensis]WAM31994.1 sulfite exporter TauE/SafE family protein [Caldicellulosiruptor naganoensis]
MILEVLLVSIIAGFVGSLLGIGGGLIVIPFLSIVFKLSMHQAAAAGLVSVIATSSGAASAYVKDRLTHLKIGMFLQLATVIGGVLGAVLSGFLPAKILSLIFGILLLYNSFLMIKNRNSDEKPRENIEGKTAQTKWARILKLYGSYYDKILDKEITYSAQNTFWGFLMMTFAGLLSGLLGIGSGIFKVLALDTIMKLPFKVSTATSNFMMGVTALASISIYLARGDIVYDICGAVAVGVLAGSLIGAKVMPYIKSKYLKVAFALVLIYTSIEMIKKGLL